MRSQRHKLAVQGVTSNGFRPTPPAAALAVTSLTPNTTASGQGPYPFAVNGTGFDATCKVNIDGVQAIQTTFVSSVKLNSLIDTDSGDGPYAVTVKKGVQTSNAINFTVT